MNCSPGADRNGALVAPTRPSRSSSSRASSRAGRVRRATPRCCYARADIVSFLDDDAEAAPDWLERLLAVYATHPGAVAVGGAPRPDYGAPAAILVPARFRLGVRLPLPLAARPARSRTPPDRHEHECASRRDARCRRVPRRRLRRHGSLAPDRPRARASRRPLRAARGGPSLRPSRAG